MPNLSEFCVAGFKLAQRVPFLLLGYLTHKPSRNESNQDTGGTLYLEDNTASIPCQVRKPLGENIHKENN